MRIVPNSYKCSFGADPTYVNNCSAIFNKLHNAYVPNRLRTCSEHENVHRYATMLPKVHTVLSTGPELIPLTSCGWWPPFSFDMPIAFRVNHLCVVGECVCVCVQSPMAWDCMLIPSTHARTHACSRVPFCAHARRNRVARGWLRIDRTHRPAASQPAPAPPSRTSSNRHAYAVRTFAVAACHCDCVRDAHRTCVGNRFADTAADT